MVGTDDFASVYVAEREGRAAVNTHFMHRVRLPVAVPPDYNRFTQQGCPQGRRAKFVAVGDGMPAAAEFIGH